VGIVVSMWQIQLLPFGTLWSFFGGAGCFNLWLVESANVEAVDMEGLVLSIICLKLY